MKISMAALSVGNLRYRRDNQDGALGFVSNGVVRFVNPVAFNGLPAMVDTGQSALKEEASQADVGGWCLVDGVGGHPGGREAARTVLQAYYDAACAFSFDSNGFHEESFARMISLLNANEEHGSASLIMGLVDRGKLRVAYSGDCRAYLVRKGNALPYLLSRDHTVLRDMIEETGRLFEPVTFDLCDRGDSPLKRCVGHDVEISCLDTRTYELSSDLVQDGDVLVLMSDGAYGAFRGTAFVTRKRKELARLVDQAHHVETLCQRIVSHALRWGSKDNTTVAVLRIDEI